MFRRILVALDGSSLAEQAVPLAARIASASGGTLIFVQAINLALDYGTYLRPVPVPQSVIDSAYEVSQAYLTSITRRDEVAGLSCETELLTGSAAEQVLAAAESRKADLIVLNSHGRSGVARWVLGSVAEHVVHHATAPVLVLRAGEQPPTQGSFAAGGRGYGLVGLDGSGLAEAALDPAVALAQALAAPQPATVRLVRVIKPLPEPDDELAPLLGDEQHRRDAHAHVRHGAAAYLQTIAERLQSGPDAPHVSWEVVEAPDTAAALIEATERAQAASGEAPSVVFMVLATHGRGGLARWTLGSVTGRVLEGSRLPLLVVRPADIAARQQSALVESAQVPTPSPLQRTAPLFPPRTHGLHAH